MNDVDIEEIIDKSLVNILDSNMREKLEGKITYSEALEALKNMKNDKSPGSNGFTAEFFKFFWRDICHFWLMSANEGFD